MKGLGKLLVEHKGNENAYSLRFYKTKSRLNTSQTWKAWSFALLTLKCLGKDRPWNLRMRFGWLG